MLTNFIRKELIYNIIIYARLSKEEKDKQNALEQSQSIKNQIEICKEYITEEQKQNPDIKYFIVEELYDDGISGTTFNREGFKKILKLIEENKVNMVITKDLSRLGRDHIETDNFIEKWFPEHNVRYVSVLDCIDTFIDSSNNDIAPIKNWINDMYAKDTSRKIKKEFKKMIAKGLWTGGEPPLGYRIDPNNKHHFIIDNNEAEVVKKIFYLAKENYSVNDISKILIKDKIPIPTLLKKNNRKLNKELIDVWSTDTIRNIIKNEMYLGHMIQGKTIKVSYKSKKIISLPKSEWIKVENTHEPIIDKNTFDIANKLLKTTNNLTKKSYNYLFKGLIICEECKHSIGIQHYKNRKNNYTICNYYRKYGNKKKVCSAHRFSYEKLESIVLENIKALFKNLEINKLLEFLMNNNYQKLIEKEIISNISSSEKNIEKVKRHIETIYEDKLNNIIDNNEYIRRVKIKKHVLKNEEENLCNIKKNLDSIRKRELDKFGYMNYIIDFLNLKYLNKKIINQLIKKIVISEEGVVKIYYNFTI